MAGAGRPMFWDFFWGMRGMTEYPVVPPAIEIVPATEVHVAGITEIYNDVVRNSTAIYSSEPVFAGILGRFAGERLGMMGWAGAALILCGVVVGELKPRRWHARD